MDFRSDIAHIGGWLTEGEAEFLYKAAKQLSEKDNIIEIGSWKGRSTICLALGAKEGNKAIVYAVDPHVGSSEHHKLFGKVDTYQEFLKNIDQADVGELVVPIRSTSEEYAREFNKEVTFVFVDGAHEYNFVRKDHEKWFPKLKVGGLIAFHDSWHQLSVQFLTTQLLVTGKVKDPRLIDTLTVMEKTDKVFFIERLRNVGFVIYRALSGWIGTVKIDRTGTVLN